MVDISEKLKKIRKERNLTIQAVTEGACLALRTYQNYEYGKREISTEALLRLADFYGVSTDYLLGREEKNPFSSFKPVNDEEFIRLYSALPEPVKEAFVGVMAQLAQAQKSKSKKAPPKADSKPQLFIAASDGNPVTEMDKGVIDRLKSAKPIDDDF